MSDIQNAQRAAEEERYKLAQRMIDAGHEVAHRAAEGGGYPLHVVKGKGWLRTAIAHALEGHEDRIRKELDEEGY